MVCKQKEQAGPFVPPALFVIGCSLQNIVMQDTTARGGSQAPSSCVHSLQEKSLRI